MVGTMPWALGEDRPLQNLWPVSLDCALFHFVATFVARDFVP